MSRKTRGTQIKVEEAVEVSSDEIELDLEPEEIKGEIFIPTQTQSQCVMIVPGITFIEHKWGKLNEILSECFKDSLCKNQSFSVVKLRNPRTLSSSLYAFSPKDSAVYEINQFTEDKRWVFESLELKANFKLKLIFEFFWLQVMVH